MNRISKNQAMVAKGLFGLLIAITLLMLARPIITGAKDSTKPAAKAPSREVKSEVGERDELAQKIEQAIGDSEFAYARWGISVISLANGSVIYQRDADKLFTPASNMKIYTTGVALNLLGVDYRWRTSVYANSPPANGSIQGDLTLYGRGAPDLVASSKDDDRGSLAKLAEDLYSRGVRSVAGDVIGDESYFRGDPLGDGWQWTDLQWYFGAEASALSINGNEVDINFVPASKAAGESTVRSSDTEGYVTVQNRMSAAADSSTRSTIGVHRGLSDNNIEVWGEYAPGSKGFGARLSVHKPALWAAKLFVRALRTRGIQVYGRTLSRDSRAPQNQRFDPSRAVELASIESQPLSEIAKKTNKESNNLFAELILRTLGRERGELVALPQGAGREIGDDEAGLAVIRLWLTRAGISTTQLALHDGSGLSRLDLVTPETSARLLLF